MDPYAALRYKEFNIFLLVRFAMVFAWSMQFIVIEWQVYSLTKDPLSLGIIGLMEVVPAVSMALFAGHIVDQKEKRNLLVVCIAGFSLISLALSCSDRMARMSTPMCSCAAVRVPVFAYSPNSRISLQRET